MTTETQSAPETGPISLDQFTALMNSEDEKRTAALTEPAKDEPQTDAEPVTAKEVADAEELEASIDGEDDPEVDEPDEEDAAPEPIPDPPQSWSKEDREGWAELTPKAREVVLKREGDRDKAVAQAVQKASEAVKAVQTLAAQTQEIAELGMTEFEKKWGPGEEGTVDWVRLAQLSRQYPDQYDYVSTRAQFDAERNALRQAQIAAHQQSELAQRTFLAEEAHKLTSLEPELVDAKEGQARRTKVFEHLADRGIPRDLFPQISALELSIAYDAFRWRESQKAAKAAAAMPRKNPTAPASKVVKPTGEGGVSPQRNLQSLSASLTKSGKLDDFVALMNAEEEQRARKARR